MSKNNWTGVIGLMSGTSLDGLDCCYVEFSNDNGQFNYRNLLAKTYPYDEAWEHRLRTAMEIDSLELTFLDAEYGKYLGEKVNQFIGEMKLENKVALVSSHGHTVFHQPQKKITIQIGYGEVLNKTCNIPVICDFRTKDVQLGGQGAPLVPVGDHYLFAEYASCLNLGGFSNISLIYSNKRIAFDISPCNLPLNHLCQKHFNLAYDKGGAIAKSGQVIEPLLNELNSLEFYQQQPPKSLGAEWLRANFYPVIDRYNDISPANIICTITQHIADQIIRVLKNYHLKEVMVTGGGAYNQHLINHLENKGAKIILPPSEIIEFKEALIFAFLGYLNLTNSINTFKSVTGAREDSMGGVRYFGHQH